jgi:AcrR family transcriptional regulator
MTKPDLKERTAALRQQHVLDAAIRVFEADGYRGATIRSIAQEAGVSDGTIYNIFENKEALLFAVLDGLLQGDAVGELPLPQDIQSMPSLENMIAARWEQITPKALAMMRIIWSEALTDRALAKRYADTILAPSLDGLKPLMTLSEAGAQDTPLLQRSIVALVLGLILMKLLGDPVLDARMNDVPGVLSKLLEHGIFHQHKTVA